MRQLFVALALAAMLAACARSGPSALPEGASPDWKSLAAPATGTTRGWGYLYSDPDGKPLAGVRVAIAAWTPVNGKLERAREVARTDATGRFEFTAPNGKYLLTIGSDTAYTPPPGYQTPNPLTSVGADPGIPGVTWLATVHDTIVLSGGIEQIKASILPKQIMGGKKGGPYKYAPVPKVEDSRDYRITQLSKIEAECLAAEQIRRHDLHRDPLVPDEWLMENTRAMHSAQVIERLVWNGFAWGAIGEPPKTPQSSTAGGPTCAVIVLDQAMTKQEADRNTLWFGASDGLSKPDQKTGGRTVLEIQEWFIDPRTTPQVWPSPVTGPKAG